jgi:23S rRNA (cytidine1920-2'-O)/16S rRNA (cytidine1409-2'-O)-methyltransferase
LFDGLKTAQGWIMAGKVVVDGRVVTKPGTPVKPSARITLRGVPARFASRGGEKLDHALRRFTIDLAGKVCLDAGASTGGFTDCMLQYGARRVYAVEAGYGQLRGRLAADPRVVSMERTNLSEVHADRLVPAIEFAAADLSYLSLRKAVPIIAERFTRHSPEMVCLIKPLYEGLAQDRIDDRQALRHVLQALLADLAAAGFPVLDLFASPLIGGRGAVEFLARFGPGVPAEKIDVMIARAIEELRSHPSREPPDFDS